jgi:hypothetical protein
VEGNKGARLLREEARGGGVGCRRAETDTQGPDEVHINQIGKREIKTRVPEIRERYERVAHLEKGLRAKL